MQQDGRELFARCASGFEKVLAQELRDLRMRRVRPLAGGVAYYGDKTDAYETCLWSRVATRIQLVVARVDARSAQSLYEGVRGIAWEGQVRDGATIAVRAHGTNDALHNTSFVALKVKDAVCDRLREARGQRPNVDAHDPDLAIDVALHQARATVYINLSGESLHRRGYREEGVQTAAPLKETLAAGMLLAAGWNRLARAGASFVDPMCGSGTLAIEAALIACDVAPGLLRGRWGFEGWAGHNEALWQDVVRRARERRHLPSPTTRILAGDVDNSAVRIAEQNAARARVGEAVTLFCDDAAHLSKHVRALRKTRAGGLLACNPPYGERLQAPTELAGTYRALAQAIGAVGSLGGGWQVAVISPDARIETALGRDARQRISCHNGPLDTWLRVYDLGDEPRTCDIVSLAGKSLRIAIADPHSAQFATRLRKVARDRMRWARRAGIEAFRLYECDLPDYALSVDAFRTADGDEAPHVLMRELARPKGTEPLVALRRLADAEAIALAVMDLPDGHVLTRPLDSASRRGRKGGASPDAAAGPALLVREGGLRHAVDLAQAEDTLPLVLRGVRELCASKARGKRVACAFVTDVACVAELMAQRPSSLTVVDARERMRRLVTDCLARNAMDPRALRFQGMDPLTWAEAEARSKRRYDLVVCAAPEWVGRRENGGREWDLARDHQAIVRNLARILAPGGALVFATTEDAPGYAPEGLTPAGLAVRDVSAAVLPADFAHTRIPLHCLELKRLR